MLRRVARRAPGDPVPRPLVYHRLMEARRRLLRARNTRARSLDAARERLERLLRVQAQALQGCAAAALACMNGDVSLPGALQSLRDRAAACLARRDAARARVRGALTALQAEVGELSARYHARPPVGHADAPSQCTRVRLKSDLKAAHARREALLEQERSLVAGRDEDSLHAVALLTESLAACSENDRAAAAAATGAPAGSAPRRLVAVQAALNQGRAALDAGAEHLADLDGCLERAGRAAAKMRRASESAVWPTQAWDDYLKGTLDLTSLLAAAGVSETA